MKSHLKYLPNIITIGRMLAILPLAWLLWHKEYKMALLVAFLAGMSDGLDGFLAKRFGWQGWLGGILDPLADKLLMLCCYSVFFIQQVVPWWLFVLVILRDVVIVTGASYYHFRIGKIKKATPTLISKLNTVFQILLILVLLLSYSGLLDLFFIHHILMLVVALFTVLTGIHYVWLGLRMAKQQRQQVEI